MPGLQSAARSVLDAILALHPGLELLAGFGHDELLQRHASPVSRTADLVVDEAVVEPGVRGIVRRARKHDAVGSCPVDRTQAHRAGLATAVDLTPIQLKRPECLAGFPDRYDFSMGRRVT